MRAEPSAKEYARALIAAADVDQQQARALRQAARDALACKESRRVPRSDNCGCFCCEVYAELQSKGYDMPAFLKGRK